MARWVLALPMVIMLKLPSSADVSSCESSQLHNLFLKTDMIIE